MNISAVHDGYLPRAVAPTPAARRRRRHRARRKQDHFVVPVERKRGAMDSPTTDE